MRIKAQMDAARPDMSVLLSASAGSGKTHVLVKRMVHLLATGVPPDAVVAATFSEKAAAQMRERLYDTLSRAAREGVDSAALLELKPEDAPYPIVKTPEEILSGLGREPDSLRIMTIHALCLWILRRFPLEAGLPPDFSVMEDWEPPLRREEAVDARLDTLRSGDLMEDFTSLTELGYTYSGVRGLILIAFEKRPHIMKLAVDAGGPEKLVGNIRESLDAERRMAVAAEALESLELQQRAAALSGILRDAEGLGAYKDALEALASARGVEGFRQTFGWLRRFLYTQKGEPQKRTPLSLQAAKSMSRRTDPALNGKSLEETAAAIKREHDDLFMAMREDAGNVAMILDYVDGARALIALLRLFFEAEAVYSGSCRAEGLVDFDDLEICAYGLICRSVFAGLLSSLESRASHFMVDEFQDTGELQWGILERLGSEAFSGTGVEGAGSPTFFAVGDRKQSIYRFRMANYRLMDRLKEKMEKGIVPERRALPHIEHNFRSAPEILRVVDETFGALLPGEYAPAVAARTNACGSASLRFEPVESEPDALAGEIEAALGLSVWDGDAGDFRPAGYGDMAVLLRSRRRLGAYEDALRRRGIPFKVIGGVGFFRQEEVRSIIGLLNYLDDPADTLSLASALKSPLFGLGDGELEVLFRSGEPLSALAEISPEASRLIARWRGLAGTSTPGRIVEEVIEGSAARFVFGLRGGPSALLNIEKLSGMAREFDRRGGAGLTEFTGWVKLYRDSADMSGADVELPEYRGFVSVMTTHAAKGLEFPVVFIAGADTLPGRQSGRFIAGTASAGDMAVYTASLLGDNPIYGRLKETEREESVDEAKRLLYVAMTRAMDHLNILAGCKTKEVGPCNPSEESWAGLILKAAPPCLIPDKADVPWPSSVYQYPAGPVTKLGGGASEESLGHAAQSPPSAKRLSPLPSLRGSSFISPSSLAELLPEEPVQQRPYPSTLRGSSIHRAIETLGKTGDYDARAACAAQKGFCTLAPADASELVRDVEATVSRLIEDGAMRALLSPGENKYFELPLMLEKDGDIVHGIADLVVQEGGTADVYDFKTGFAGVPNDAISRAYAPQLDAYRLAVKEALGAKNTRAFILLADTAELIRL